MFLFVCEFSPLEVSANTSAHLQWIVPYLGLGSALERCSVAGRI